VVSMRSLTRSLSPYAVPGPADSVPQVTAASLVVPARFNGPPGSANGGYVAGLLAAHVPPKDLPGDHAVVVVVPERGQAVRVTLREPPPLGTVLLVAAGDTDGQVVASFGGAVVATAEPGGFETEPVPPVSFEVAAQAEHRYAGLTTHPFPACFVCGPDRPAADGMGLRPGRVGTGADAAVATTWVPDSSLAAGDGLVGEPFVWAALDCPSGWAGDLEDRPMVLGRITAAVHARPVTGDRCVVVASRLGGEGRKAFTASTAYDGDGRVLGRAEATWIALR